MESLQIIGMQAKCLYVFVYIIFLPFLSPLLTHSKIAYGIWMGAEHWYIIIISLQTIFPSPNQFIVSVSRDLIIHMSIENGKYVESNGR